MAGWPFTSIGWAVFGAGWVFLFVAERFFQQGCDVAGRATTSNSIPLLSQFACKP
jgi:hypothetical protein